MSKPNQSPAITTPNENSGPSSQKRRPVLFWTVHYAGMLPLVFGSTLVGTFIARQLQESNSGHTYYEFIGVGTVLAVIGLIIIILNIRRSRVAR